MRTGTRRMIIAVLATTILSTAWATAGDVWFRLGGAYVQPYGDVSGRSEEFEVDRFGRPIFRIDTTSMLSADGATGLTFSFEYRPNEDFGFELAASRGTHGLDFTRLTERVDLRRGSPTEGQVIESSTESARPELELTLTTLALNLYVDRRENFDLIVGPVVGYAIYDEINVPDLGSGAQTADVDEDVVFGLVAGAGFKVGERWDFRSSVRWIKTNADFELVELSDDGAQTVPIALDIDPLSFEFTFGLRF